MTVRVLVTGGCGYVGSALVPRLQEASAIDEVRVLDTLSSGSPANLAAADVARSDFEFHEGDVRDYGVVEAATRDVDAIVHLRALTDRPLTVYGDGSNWRPFVHVEDAARAFADAAIRPERWPAAVYNVGASAENYRIETIAETGFDLQWSLPEGVADLAARLGGARAEDGTVQSALAGGETDD